MVKIGIILKILAVMFAFAGAVFLITTVYDYVLSDELMIFEQVLSVLLMTWNDVDFGPEIFTIRPVTTFIWAISGAAGGVILVINKGNKWIGGSVILAAGVLSLLGMFIIIGTITDGPTWSITYSLSYSFFDWGIEPALLIVGGVLGLIGTKLTPTS
ncbi:MAG: hypothetical protein ACTSRT_15460 [Promethearchaeota archaeon]